MTAINTNVSALNAQYYLANTNKDMEQSMQRLSSGFRVNSAADDAAGMAIASRMEAQTRGLTMAIKNANDAVSLALTAEGALSEVTNMLQRIRELAVNSASGTLNDSDRLSLDNEVQALKAEIDRVGATTTFNSQNLLDGTYKGTFQIGDKDGQTVDLKIASAMTSALGMGGGASGANSVISARIGSNAATPATDNFLAVDAGDITINGQALGAISATDDMEDLISNINTNVDNVTASGFNVIVAETKGTGVTTDGQFVISVSELGVPISDATTYNISASNNMDELVANINSETGGVVAATVNESGKLVLSNDTGATITITDTAGAGGLSSTATKYAGFLKLSSDDGSTIRIEKGNKGLTASGSDADLLSIGFRETKSITEGDGYTVRGAQLTSPETALVNGDLNINGVDIFDADIATTSFAGKLSVINSFSTETGVTASAYFEETFAVTDDDVVVGEIIKINGQELTHTTGTVAGLVTLLNTKSNETGLTATQNGNNVTLSGENVSSLTIDYATADDLTDELVSVDSAGNSLINGVLQDVDTATPATARGLAIAAGDVAAGRTYNFKSDGGTTGVAFDVSYTATASDDKDSIAVALANLVRNADSSFMDTEANAVDSSTTAGTITFQTGMNQGDAAIEFLITSPKDVLGTSVTAGTPQTRYGSIQLDSVNNSPIKIDVGETNAGANHAARHGFIESNVGAADFDVNDPTLSAAGGSSMSGLSIASAAGAASALNTLDNAIDSVNAIRGDLGAVQNRLSYTTNNLSSIVTNTEGAKGRIMDADFAVETSKLAKSQILSQAATSMLAQANQSKQGILALLQ
ncbi:flagellin [Alphaproteobacteria bacterium]|nr:flagellin [Alphaproteobacteria bacterium]